MDNKDIREENVSRIDHFDLGGMDWVIFAVPISQMERAVRESAGFLSAGTLVMDVCSVKVHPMQVLKNNLDERVEILGTHPMFGPDSAGYGLKGLQMVLCPERISPETLRIVKDVFSGLGLSLLEKTPQEHDRQTAKSLALVHYLGRALHDMDLKGLELTTLGMERLLAIDETVSNDTWELFLDMHVYNPYTGEVRRELRERLQNLEHKINNKINNKEEL
jgi:prephenate dehydrogenase